MIRGLISWMRSQVKPMPVHRARAEVLHHDVARLEQLGEDLLALSDFMLSVMLRLLQLSIVK